MVDVNALTRLLKVFLATIESLDQEQIEQLLAGKARLAFAGPKSTKAGATPPADQAELVQRLNEVTDREQARDILRVVTTRDGLAALARTLKVHVVKHDRKEDIESKLVEFIIGGRLRAEAIRSLNLKASGSSRSDE